MGYDFHVEYVHGAENKIADVLSAQLSDHLMLNNSQNEIQSAYRTGFSAKTSLIRIADHIL